jgi:hypothetical protein
MCWSRLIKEKFTGYQGSNGTYQTNFPSIQKIFALHALHALHVHVCTMCWYENLHVQCGSVWDFCSSLCSKMQHCDAIQCSFISRSKILCWTRDIRGCRSLSARTIASIIGQPLWTRVGHLFVLVGGTSHKWCQQLMFRFNWFSRLTHGNNLLLVLFKSRGWRHLVCYDRIH